MIKIKKCRRQPGLWVVHWREGDGYHRSRAFNAPGDATLYGLKLSGRLQLDRLDADLGVR
ncbi:MAG: hypothetical protein V4701_01315 [Pseudomonadota bacterium]